jgi:zinc protease
MLRAILLASMLSVAAQSAAQSAAAQAVSPAARAAWGFDRSDLAPHPGVRFGVLPNGMRYAIMRNATPAGGVSVRFRIAVGAAAEGDGEAGLVHLLEHMVFEGTRRIPQRMMPRWLARHGLVGLNGFNAFTDYHQTVYRLELIGSGAGPETALTLMREIASELVLSRQAVERAKAMVVAEIEGRDSGQDRLATALNAFLMPGSAIARGPVAATTESVRRADPAALDRMYRMHYRPERATLILVGDFDPDAVEARIAARFGDWRGGPPAGAVRLDPPIDPGRRSEARLFVDPEVPTGVTIASVSPLGADADAGAPRDRLFLEQLGSEMLSRRLARIASRPDAPFAGGSSAIYDHFSTARLVRIEVGAKDRDWRSALRTGQQELQRALRDGFSQAELDEQLAISRRGLDRQAGPQSSASLAEAIVGTLERGTVFTARQDPASAMAYLARIRLADVNAAFRAAWSRPGRLIFVAHNAPVPDAEEALAEAVRGQVQ